MYYLNPSLTYPFIRAAISKFLFLAIFLLFFYADSAVAECRRIAVLVDAPNSLTKAQDKKFLGEAFAKHNLCYEEIVWTEPRQEWRNFAAVVIRTTWSYSDNQENYDRFLSLFGSN